MNNFLCADHHFNHQAILSFYSQPFKTIEERNETIVKNHNSRVQKNDIVHIVGDFCFYKDNFNYWKEKLNGDKIFYKGNHDRKSNGSNIKLIAGVLNAGGMSIKIVHDPIYADANYVLNLTAHVHEKWHIKSFKEFYKDRLTDLRSDLPEKYLNKVKIFVDKWKNKPRNSLLINIGLDHNNYYPYKLEEVLSIYYSWKKNQKERIYG